MQNERMSASLLAVLACLLTTACERPLAGPERGAQLYETCVPCHGADGGGNQDLLAPSIAGMERWYLEVQLEKFQDGTRGSHPDDMQGARMRPMARTLNHEDDIASVAEFVSMMPRVVQPPTVMGDATAGEAAYGVCIGCHGLNGRGVEAMKAPGLVGLSDWYQVVQLEKFKSGQRGANPEDVQGALMRAMAMGLYTEQLVRDVVVYVQTLE